MKFRTLIFCLFLFLTGCLNSTEISAIHGKIYNYSNYDFSHLRFEIHYDYDKKGCGTHCASNYKIFEVTVGSDGTFETPVVKRGSPDDTLGICIFDDTNTTYRCSGIYGEGKYAFGRGFEKLQEDLSKISIYTVPRIKYHFETNGNDIPDSFFSQSSVNFEVEIRVVDLDNPSFDWSKVLGLAGETTNDLIWSHVSNSAEILPEPFVGKAFEPAFMLLGSDYGADPQVDYRYSLFALGGNIGKFPLLQRTASNRLSELIDFFNNTPVSFDPSVLIH